MATACTTTNCLKNATMKCPKCVQLGIQDSYFCSQDCFKGFWKEHKIVHDMFNEIFKAKSGFVENDELIWPGYNFTGPMKPYRQSATRKIPPHIAKPDYWESGVPESERTSRGSNTIVALTELEQQKARTVCALAREVLDIAVKVAKPGVTTDEIDRVVHEACIARDCYPSPLNYYNFPKSCCTSVNEVICHGIPDLRPLEDGDILNIDITVFHDGFHGDLNETIYIGTVDEHSRKLVRTAYECLEKSMEMIKPGTRYRDIGDVITKHASANNCSVVRTYCGHGINRLFHCAPNVPHYSKNKAVGIMKPGHIFTIEPMINAGVWRDNTWPDNWTAVTADGRRSAQFEQTFLVTDSGYEVLTGRRQHGGRPHFIDQEEDEAERRRLADALQQARLNGDDDDGDH